MCICVVCRRVLDLNMGIPHATIIGKDGLIFWNGHPMSIDEPLRLCDGVLALASNKIPIRNNIDGISHF